jgi:hypothetical protein
MLAYLFVNMYVSNVWMFGGDDGDDDANLRTMHCRLDFAWQPIAA